MGVEARATSLKIASTKKPTRPATSAMVVGKDILELISGGMYIDPLAMIREYIQNSVDSIDEAKKKRKYRKKSPAISIQIDRANRALRIRDNGIGIARKGFERSMVSVGASQKVNSDARGFRGVGRFAGLSYCRELIFRTSYSGEGTISEIRWDGMQFKKLITDSAYTGDLRTFLGDIAEVSFEDWANVSEHFFEVELRGIIRIKNDQLLNELELYDYLAQHAPVPFSPEFKFGTELTEFLSTKGVYSAYEITLEADDEMRTVFRPYRDTFALSESLEDKFQNVEFIEIEGIHGGICAVGWILDHGYFGVIPKTQLIRGLRVREGNIQIGKSDLMSVAFPEPRFNSWSVGEIHIVNRHLVPTGRRDDFELNTRYANFVNKVSMYGKKIAKICRRKSQERNRIKEFELEEERANVNLNVLKQAAISNSYKSEVKKAVHVSLEKLRSTAKAEILPEHTRVDLQNRAKNVSDAYDAIEGEDKLGSPLDKLPKNKQTVYKQIFDLIYECSQNRTVAQRLIDQILTRL